MLLEGSEPVSRLAAVALLVPMVVCCSNDPSGNTAAGGSAGGAAGGSVSGIGGTGGGSAGTGGAALAGNGGSIASGGSPGDPNAPLFMEAPDCDPNASKLEGSFQGLTVAESDPLRSNTLEGRSYYTVHVTPRSQLRLEWADSLEPNVVQPLTGGYFLTFWDTANPDVLYCVVAGEIGPLPTEREQDDYFKFAITRAHTGEVGTTGFAMPATCDGEELDADLRGCVFRYAN